MSKWIWIIIAIIIGAGAYFLINQSFIDDGTQIDESELEIVEVEIGTLTASIGATGKVIVIKIIPC